MAHVERQTAVADTVARILAHAGPVIRLAAPLGLGKPNVLLNALYRAVVAEPERQLHLFTALSLQSAALPSGAGHDAQMVAALCPMGMIFVPSIGGISHSPMERTSWEDCARGAAVLLGAILEIDAKDTL